MTYQEIFPAGSGISPNHPGKIGNHTLYPSRPPSPSAKDHQPGPYTQQAQVKTTRPRPRWLRMSSVTSSPQKRVSSHNDPGAAGLNACIVHVTANRKGGKVRRGRFTNRGIANPSTPGNAILGLRMAARTPHLPSLPAPTAHPVHGPNGPFCGDSSLTAWRSRGLRPRSPP
jgi:hypothetical protein